MPASDHRLIKSDRVHEKLVVISGANSDVSYVAADCDRHGRYVPVRIFRRCLESVRTYEDRPFRGSSLFCGSSLLVVHPFGGLSI